MGKAVFGIFQNNISHCIISRIDNAYYLIDKSIEIFISHLFSDIKVPSFLIILPLLFVFLMIYRLLHMIYGVAA